MHTQTLDEGAKAALAAHSERVRGSVRLVRLASGRRVAYSEYGDSNGYPLLYCHSQGSSRLEAASFHKSAKAAGYRIIALDRPGIGFSDFDPCSSSETVAQALLSVADRLRYQRFGVLATGAGVTHALALAAQTPERVSVLLGMSCKFPQIPLPGAKPHKLLCKLSIAALKATMALRHFLAARTPERYMPRLVEALPYVDRRLFENPKLMAFVEQGLQEALRQGVRGVAQDTALQLCPMHLDFARLQMPCHFWQGAADCSQARHARTRFVSRCPQGELHDLAHRGRYFYLRYVEEVFTTANVLLERNLRRVPGHKSALTTRSVVQQSTARLAASHR